MRYECLPVLRFQENNPANLEPLSTPNRPEPVVNPITGIPAIPQNPWGIPTLPPQPNTRRIPDSTPIPSAPAVPNQPLFPPFNPDRKDLF